MKKNIVLAFVLCLAVADLAFAQEKNQITGTVIPVPILHYQGSPTNDWFVSAIHVQVGDRIKAGTCVIELDPAKLPQEKAKGELDAAKAHVEAAKANLATQEKLLGRCDQLLPAQAVCLSEFDTLLGTVKILRAELSKAQAQERAATANLGMIKYNYDFYQKMICPIAGEVVDINCSLGLVARATEKQLVLIRVLDDSRVQIQCEVSPKQAAALRMLKIAQAVDPRIKIGIADTKCCAKIISVPRLIKNGKVTVTLEAANPDSELECGQDVTLNLP